MPKSIIFLMRIISREVIWKENKRTKSEEEQLLWFDAKYIFVAVCISIQITISIFHTYFIRVCFLAHTLFNFQWFQWQIKYFQLPIFQCKCVFPSINFLVYFINISQFFQCFLQIFYYFSGGNFFNTHSLHTFNQLFEYFDLIKKENNNIELNSDILKKEKQDKKINNQPNNWRDPLNLENVRTSFTRTIAHHSLRSDATRSNSASVSESGIACYLQINSPPLSLSLPHFLYAIFW